MVTKECIVVCLSTIVASPCASPCADDENEAGERHTAYQTSRLRDTALEVFHELADGVLHAGPLISIVGGEVRFVEICETGELEDAV